MYSYTTPPPSLPTNNMLKVKPERSVSLSTPEFMDEEEEEEQQTPRSPFWIQSNNLGRLHRLSSLFFNSFVLIIFLLLFALLSLVFITPSLINLSSNIFRPNLVKRSWDSINLILVFIALLFGFLTRNINININNNDENENFDDRSETDLPAGAPIMYDFQHQSSTGLRRQRTSISYPDLRELSPPWNHRASTDPRRFSDDTHLNYYNRNTFPPPPETNTVKHKMKKVYRNVGINDGERGKIILSESSEQKKKRRARSSEPKTILSPQPVSPLTESKKVDDNASQDFFSSFYHNDNKKKKKRQRDRSVDNLNALLHHSQPLPVKKNISVTLPPPRTTITRVAPFVTDKPRIMPKCFNGVEESSSGGESPMKNIPPPPPLPPFKMPDWKFTVDGDFVRLQSSRSVSPDGDEARSPLSDVEMELFCPSPDVDTKADSFIARFRAGLKLERMSKLGPDPNAF